MPIDSTARARAAAFIALAIAVFATTGCDDPAKDKAKATTTDVSTAAPPANAASSAKSENPEAASAKYVFDQNASKVAWTGSKVTGKHDGGFGAFKGTVDVVDGAPEKSKVNVEIETDSITSDVEKLTGHLKSADFFDVKEHPKATFTSTEIKKGGDKGATHTVTGNLTIKGITKTVTFPATIQVAGDKASVDAEFAINRRDFQLNYAGMPNDLIRNDVVIKLTMRGERKKA